MSAEHPGALAAAVIAAADAMAADARTAGDCAGWPARARAVATAWAAAREAADSASAAAYRRNLARQMAAIMAAITGGLVAAAGGDPVGAQRLDAAYAAAQRALDAATAADLAPIMAQLAAGAGYGAGISALADAGEYWICSGWRCAPVERMEAIAAVLAARSLLLAHRSELCDAQRTRSGDPLLAEAEAEAEAEAVECAQRAARERLDRGIHEGAAAAETEYWHRASEELTA